MDGKLQNTVYKNPELKSLEMVQLNISSEGVNQTVPALSKHFVEEKYFLHYEPPKFYNEDGTEIIGAREHWIELITYIIDDLNWLRSLKYHKFWSNVIYNPKIKHSLTIFLQDAPPYFYLESLPNSKEVNDLLNKLYHNVLVIFARLVTNAESPTEFMDNKVLGKLLYDNYIFTAPIILDICQHYGRDNRKIVRKILESLFTLQPLYMKDLEETVPHILQIFRNIEQRFEDRPIPLAGEVVKLTERGGLSLEISIETLKDVVLHLLDTVSTIGIFLEVYPPAISLYKNEGFVMKLVSVYSNAIPEMYKKLQILTDEENCTQLRHFLDVTRMECLSLFRTIIYKNIDDILEATYPLSEEEVKTRVDSFIDLLSNALTEAEFTKDYITLYPIDVDIDILTHVYPTIDSVKMDYINQMLSTTSNIFDEDFVKDNKKNRNSSPDLASDLKRTDNDEILEVHLVTLVTEVKDVLCDLDEQFIVKCLKYYNYNSESVINAVLENSLPPEIINEETPVSCNSEQAVASTSKAETTNFNNIGNIDINNENIDELCDKIAKVIVNTGIHQEKRGYNYENVEEMLNDKSHIKKNIDIYNKFSLVADEYDDEYDDTYDDQDIGDAVQDDTIEVDRPFTMPRVLVKNRNQFENATNHGDESDENAEEEVKIPADQFVEDPAKLRARAEERFLSKRGRGGRGTFPRQERNVTGNPRGQGQEKTVLNNRNKKNVNKSSQANHNRRAGSSWKKRQGMVPS